MRLEHFFMPPALNVDVLPTRYDAGLVLTSILVAITASFIGLNLVRLAREYRPERPYILWLAPAIIALGCGIWAMHFLGMLAFHLPIPVSYRIDITAASLLPALVAAWIGLHILGRDHIGLAALLLGGTTIGLGICLMHYIGMSAIRLDAIMYHDRLIFSLSIIVSIILSTLSLWINISLGARDHAILATIISAIVLGCAISSMHYVGMESALFVPDASVVHISQAAIAFHDHLDEIIIAAVTAIFLVALYTIQLQRREALAQALAEQSRSKAELLDAQLQGVADNLPGAIYRFCRHPDGTYSLPYTSEAFGNLFDVDPNRLRNDASDVIEKIHPDDIERIVESVEHSARTMTTWHQEHRICHSDGSVRWLMGKAQPHVGRDAAIDWSGFVMDITAQKDAEAKIQMMAYYDSLTGLANREFLFERMGRSISRLARTGQFGALFFIDLDRFKQLNDLKGHSAGDTLLVELASGIKNALNPEDIVARLGGDEFVVAVEGLGASSARAAEKAYVIANRLLDAARSTTGSVMETSASIGVALFGGPLQLDHEEVIKRADIAMYDAKRAGGDRSRFFDSQMAQAAEARALLESEIRAGLEQGAFELYLQPQVNDAAEPVGMEALVRWNHPTDGLRLPDQFIPLAEEVGLINALGCRALKEACAQLRQWRRHDALRPLTLSINVSPKQFYRGDFVSTLEQALQEADVPPMALKIELTETVLIEDLRDAARKIQSLREIGIETSIDDFGKGYSSLSYLTQLNVTEIKIDRAFVGALETTDRDKHMAIIEAIVSLGRGLGLVVCAEGIETDAQFAAVRRLGCHRFQGFLFGFPRPAAETASVICSLSSQHRFTSNS